MILSSEDRLERTGRADTKTVCQPSQASWLTFTTYRHTADTKQPVQRIRRKLKENEKQATYRTVSTWEKSYIK